MRRHHFISLMTYSLLLKSLLIVTSVFKLLFQYKLRQLFAPQIFSHNVNERVYVCVRKVAPTYPLIIQMCQENVTQEW